MIFNSLEFIIFLPVVFLLYWFVFSKSLRLQNVFVLFASYVFYCWWDWRPAVLLTMTIVCTYLCGLWINKAQNSEEEQTEEKVWYKNKAYLITLGCIAFNLAILFYFKYYNFFVENFAKAFSFFGKPLEIRTLHIILPLGISFYTFQAIGYTVDIYRKRAEAARDFISFAAFMSFFTKITAGPIERATNFLPQFFVKKTFDYSNAVDGLRQILWGAFTKVVIGDGAAICVNYIYSRFDLLPGSTLAVGAIFYAVQIYADFSGYSDIALGSSRLLGFNLTRNFAFPYFARDIIEFWRRWHISLTAWLTDYLFTPLSIQFRNYGSFGLAYAVLITFLISGLWHGANWTFIVWGLYQGVFIILTSIPQKRRKKFEKRYGLKDNSFYQFTCIFLTFVIVSMGLIFFRADSLPQAFSYIGQMFSSSLFTSPIRATYVGKYIVFLIPLMFIFEWIQRNKNHALQLDNVRSKPLRWIIYFSLLYLIFNYGGVQVPFIYFNF